MSAFGTSARGVEKILQRHLIRSTEKSVNKIQSISQIAHDLQVRQTQGQDLKLLGEYICEIFQRSLLLENLRAKSRNSSDVESIDCGYVMSLQKWTAEIFIKAGQKAYFGEALSNIDPMLPQTLIEFDSLSWQVFYQYPKCLRRRLNNISGKILSSLSRYLEIPSEDRRGKAWFTIALEQKYREAGLTNEDIACQMLFLYWGQVSFVIFRVMDADLCRINTNTSKVSFWIIAHMLFIPDLAESIREETKPAFRPDGSFDTNYIYSSCPRLDSLWLETLRVSATSTTVRNITSNTTVGGKLLQKGAKLFISARQLHFSSTDFGDDAIKFNPNRFLENPRLQRSSAFRPFGGGATQCPGRFLAKHMVLNFVALLLHKFDVSLAVPQPLPRYQESKPAIGISFGDGDLQVRLRERAASKVNK